MAKNNIGSGQQKRVADRKLPTKLDPECMRSAKRGGQGKGLNDQTMNESLADMGQASEIEE